MRFPCEESAIASGDYAHLTLCAPSSEHKRRNYMKITSISFEISFISPDAQHVVAFMQFTRKTAISMEFHLLLNTRGRFRAFPRHSAAGSRALANARFRKNARKPSENLKNPQISMLMETRHNEENLLLVFTRQQLNLDFFRLRRLTKRRRDRLCCGECKSSNSLTLWSEDIKRSH